MIHIFIQRGTAGPGHRTESTGSRTESPGHRIAVRAGLVLLTAVLAACSVDHGLEPIRSKIGGTVTFLGDANPSNTDEVRVAVIKQFPPRDITELTFSDMIFGNSDKPNTVRPWEIFLAPGSYQIVAVIWKAHNQSWNISDIIGMHGGMFIGDQLVPPYPFPTIVLADAGSVIDTLNITANLNRVNRDATIEGTVTFTGDWPKNTGVIGIGAFTEIPQRGNVLDYLIKNVALDYSIATFVDHADYRLRVRKTDAIRYMAVMWIADSYDFNSITDVGAYRNPADPSVPGTIDASSGSATGIDIAVDFSQTQGGGQ
jgi:hypothetical protein